jgi:hypothetical protein
LTENFLCSLSPEAHRGCDTTNAQKSDDADEQLRPEQR